MSEQKSVLNDKNIVSRSRQLIDSKFPEWGVGTLNVFDTYLSKINPLDPNSSEVKFTKREYERLLGVSEMRPEQLNRYITKFMGNTVSIPLEKGGWENYCLFDKVRMEKLSNGEWMITLRCHPDLKGYFFELKERGYQKYQLETALSLSTKYSKLLYYNLRNHLFHKKWRITIDELRERIGVPSDVYKENKEFNKFVLKRAVSEINEKSDLIVKFQNIYRGKTITSVEFRISEKISPAEVTDNSTFESSCINLKTSEIEYDIEMLYSEACGNQLSKDQVRELYYLAKAHFDEALPYHELAKEVYDYLHKKYLSVMAKNDVKSLYGYMRDAVIRDY